MYAGNHGGAANGGAPRANPLQPLQRLLQIYMDRAAPHIAARWAALAVLLLLYAARVRALHGFYIVTYALAIYNLNLLLGFLTPLAPPPDPAGDGPALPSKADEEFRPFVRRLPEFRAWAASGRAALLAGAATFVPAFDVPVFWPILVLYWLVLFFVTMKRQVAHMVKHRYVPISLGKKTYGGGGGGGRRREAL